MDLLRFILRDVVQSMDAEVKAESERHLRDQARAFLQSLDADSQEGMWFDAFAESFPSRLEAAVAYVRDVKRAR